MHISLIYTQQDGMLHAQSQSVSTTRVLSTTTSSRLQERKY